MYWPSYPYQLYGRNYYMGRLIGEVVPYYNAHHLMRLGRDMQEYPDAMLASLNIQPGMIVADIGAGIGFNSLRLARLVGPYGRVFPTEIQPEMLNQLMMNAYKSGLSHNIVPTHASHFNANLPCNSFDLILMVDTYHECINPPALLSGLHRALKRNGRLVLVEYRLEDSCIPNMPDHRMSISQAKIELESNGFLLTQVFGFLPWQHILIFNKI